MSLSERAGYLRSAFNYRVLKLNDFSEMRREGTEAEALRMTACLAINEGYSWAELREAVSEQPEVLSLLPDKEARH